MARTLPRVRPAKSTQLRAQLFTQRDGFRIRAWDHAPNFRASHPRAVWLGKQTHQAEAAVLTQGVGCNRELAIPLDDSKHGALRRDGVDPDTDFSGSLFVRYRVGDLG